MGPWSSSGTSNRHTNTAARERESRMVGAGRIICAEYQNKGWTTRRNWNESGDCSPAHSKVQTEIILRCWRIYHERVNKYYWRARESKDAYINIFSPDGAAAHRARTTPDGRAHYSAAEAKYPHLRALCWINAPRPVFFVLWPQPGGNDRIRGALRYMSAAPRGVFNTHTYGALWFAKQQVAREPGIYIYLFVSLLDPYCTPECMLVTLENSLIISSPFAAAGCRCCYQCWNLAAEQFWWKRFAAPATDLSALKFWNVLCHTDCEVNHV